MKRTAVQPKRGTPHTRIQEAWIATGQTGSGRTREAARRYIACIRRDLDGVLLRGYYPGPGTAPRVPNKAAYRCVVCLAAECRMSSLMTWESNGRMNPELAKKGKSL